MKSTESWQQIHQDQCAEGCHIPFSETCTSPLICPRASVVRHP